MREAFISHIQSRQLLLPQQRYLLACSGGMDSMALANLLHMAGLTFEIAHVNFKLRNEESDGDQSFVENWAQKHQIPFHLKIADTKQLSSSQGISIQMAAREIRYAFFEDIRAKFNLDGILLAHHEDDQLETIFLNLLRGTGIEGIYGMSERKGWLIRPLLPFSRAELTDFMSSAGFEWREDSSNEKSDYKRNNLRHNGLPAIIGLEADARKNLLTSFERLKDTGRAFSGLFEFWKAKSIVEKDGIQHLKYVDIAHLPGGASLLYFWLRSFGFNSDQAQQIWDSLADIKPGSVFIGKDFQLWMDRTEMLLCPKSTPFESVIIKGDDTEVHLPEGIYDLSRSAAPQGIDLQLQNALLDADRLEFPLEIRLWKEGDRFVPLGMQSEKKISDFLIDLKIPAPKKQEVKVLISGNRIAWVIGMRIADWAKITPATRHTIHFKKR